MTAAALLDLPRLDGWLAIYTKPNQESIAVCNIARQGYESYCPMIMRRGSQARRREMVQRPLFPSYVFVRLRADKPQWRPLLSTRGVLTVVRFNNRLGFMPEGLVEQLRGYEASSQLQQFNAPRFEPGTEVKVAEGPFQSFIAKVLSADERGRIWLLLDIMGQAVRVQCDAWSVEH
jgi:transcriptional antiterminator RfaH